jgi:hypothetical protein
MDGKNFKLKKIARAKRPIQAMMLRMMMMMVMVYDTSKTGS